jgi:hypothetical protein
MAGEVADLVADATPYVTAAVGAYGGAVLAKVRDDAADATVGVGRRLLQRVFGRREGDPLPEGLAALAADPADPDAVGMVRWAMRQALSADAAMLEEVRAMLASAQGPVAGTRQSRIHAVRSSFTVRCGSRAWWRLALAMFLCPSRRRRLMARLRRVAMTRGAFPVLTRDLSSW